MYQVHQLGENASVTLNLLSLSPTRQEKCHNRYFVNEHVFHTEDYGQGRKTYNNRVCVQGSVSNEFEVDYYEKLEKVIELQFHSDHNRVFLFKCYWQDTTDRKIKVDPYHGFIKINTKARPHNVNDVFVFSKQCQQVYYTQTLSFRKDCSRVDWLSIVKTKPTCRVQVVQDCNDEVTMGDDVFQLDDLVDPYQVASSTDLIKRKFNLLDH